MDHYIKIPVWAAIAFLAASAFSFLVLFAVVTWALRPETAPIAITSDVAIGLHIALLQTILAAFGIALAVLGVVGWTSIRDAAARAAQDAVDRKLAASAPVAPENQTPIMPSVDTANIAVEREQKDI